MRYIPCDMPHGPALGYQAPRKRRRRVLRLALLFLPLFLFGCASPQKQACQTEVGPRPYPFAEGGGLIGSVIANMTPERKAYYAAINDCMARARRVASEP